MKLCVLSVPAIETQSLGHDVTTAVGHDAVLQDTTIVLRAHIAKPR